MAMMTQNPDSVTGELLDRIAARTTAEGETIHSKPASPKGEGL